MKQNLRNRRPLAINGRRLASITASRLIMEEVGEREDRISIPISSAWEPIAAAFEKPGLVIADAQGQILLHRPKSDRGPLESVCSLAPSRLQCAVRFGTEGMLVVSEAGEVFSISVSRKASRAIGRINGEPRLMVAGRDGALILDTGGTIHRAAFPAESWKLEKVATVSGVVALAESAEGLLVATEEALLVGVMGGGLHAKWQPVRGKGKRVTALAATPEKRAVALGFEDGSFGVAPGILEDSRVARTSLEEPIRWCAATGSSPSRVVAASENFLGIEQLG